MTIEDTLAGKDYFSEVEAAHYCCVSYGHFRRCCGDYGIVSAVFMGKKFYRRIDLEKVMEDAWHQYGIRPTASG